MLGCMSKRYICEMFETGTGIHNHQKFSPSKIVFNYDVPCFCICLCMNMGTLYSHTEDVFEQLLNIAILSCAYYAFKTTFNNLK